MEEGSAISVGSRRNEDIALDLMKFIAVTTGYGKTGSPGAGFQGSTDSKAEDYARISWISTVSAWRQCRARNRPLFAFRSLQICTRKCIRAVLELLYLPERVERRFSAALTLPPRFQLQPHWIAVGLKPRLSRRSRTRA